MCPKASRSALLSLLVLSASGCSDDSVVPRTPASPLPAPTSPSPPPIPVRYHVSGIVTDDNGSIHQADINSLRQSGITTGCTATSYCPEATIIREQMAAFLFRSFNS